MAKIIKIQNHQNHQNHQINKMIKISQIIKMIKMTKISKNQQKSAKSAKVLADHYLLLPGRNQPASYVSCSSSISRIWIPPSSSSSSSSPSAPVSFSRALRNREKRCSRAIFQSAVKDGVAVEQECFFTVFAGR